jgi:hypothetical protein
MRQEASPVPEQMWQGGEPSPGADVAGGEPSPRAAAERASAQSRCRCGRAGPALDFPYLHRPTLVIQSQLKYVDRWVRSPACCDQSPPRRRRACLCMPALLCASVLCVRVRACGPAAGVGACVFSTRLTPPTSALAPGSPLPHLHRSWLIPAHICTGTGLTPAHLHRSWARPCHIGNGTGLTAATSAPGLGSPLPTSGLRMQDQRRALSRVRHRRHRRNGRGCRAHRTDRRQAHDGRRRARRMPSAPLPPTPLRPRPCVGTSSLRCRAFAPPSRSVSVRRPDRLLLCTCRVVWCAAARTRRAVRCSQGTYHSGSRLLRYRPLRIGSGRFGRSAADPAAAVEIGALPARA